MRRSAAVLILMALLAVPALHASAGKGRLRHGTVGVVVQPPPPQPSGDCPPSGANTSLVRYVAPGASGSGLTVGTPMSMSAFLGAATTGYTAVVASGTYTAGNGGLLRPSSGRNGVTVCAADESNPPLFDGQFATIPVLFQGNSSWVVQGINAKNGTYSVIQNRDGSNNNTFRRIVAWDADIRVNGYIVWNIDSADALFEDVASFGTGCGAFSNITFAMPTSTMTLRRAWGRFEGSTSNFCPKQNFQLAYLRAVTKCENCLSTALTISMPASFTHTGGNGEDAGAGSGTTVTSPVCLLCLRSGDNVVPDGVTMLGSMAYMLASSGMPAFGRAAVSVPQINWQAKNTTVRHSAAFLSPSWSGFSQTKGFEIGAGSDATSTGNVADRLTSLRGFGDTYNTAHWTITNTVSGSTFNSIASANPWTGTAGAQFCKRWEDGVVTTTSLWPWPMDARIMQAVNTLAGAYTGPCTPTNGGTACSGGRATRAGTIPSGGVTAEIETLLQGQFGAIPPQCRS